jgi:hypothetical protein
MSGRYRFNNSTGSPLDLISCDDNPEDRDPFSFDVLPVLKGASAYDIAVKNGFVGTEAAWLASLGGSSSNAITGTFVAGQNIQLGAPVYLSRLTNKIMIADSSVYQSSFVIGYVVSAVLLGFAVEVKTGSLTLTDWSAITGSVQLDIGALYFLSLNGLLSTAKPTQPTDAAIILVGQATSATTMFYKPTLPLQL